MQITQTFNHVEPLPMSYRPTINLSHQYTIHLDTSESDNSFIWSVSGKTVNTYDMKSLRIDEDTLIADDDEYLCFFSV